MTESTPPAIVFAGSFQEYSQQILAQVAASPLVTVAAVVTTPPAPRTRQPQPLKNPVQTWAEAHQLPVFTPDTLDEISLAQLSQLLPASTPPAYLITAGYGKLLPPSWLAWPQHGALNLHFSLLPKYRGANPAEWALLLNEKLTGITLIEMSPAFDTGRMIAQASLPIAADDTRETLYAKLYELGANQLPIMIQGYAEFQRSGQLPVGDSQISFTLPPQAQPESPTPYAKRFKREDALLEWPALQAVMTGQAADRKYVSALLNSILDVSGQVLDAVFVERAVRALVGFPNLWTMITTAKGQKRMKILTSRLDSQRRLILERVQIEGQQPAAWNQVKNSVISE